MRRFVRSLLACCLLLNTAACTYRSAVTFPDPQDVFITSGDGDIQKPYTPVGELYFVDMGYRLGGPLIGLIPIKDVDPDVVLRTKVYEEIRRMGGDALINMAIDWVPPTSGLLGIGAKGGYVAVRGTVIKR